MKVNVTNKILMVKVENINPYLKNAKKHTKGQIDKLVKLIKRVGFDDPLIVDKDLTLIAGHGRLQAAKELGIKEVPVIKKDKLTKNEIKSYRIGHNKIQEGAWDEDYLAEELKELMNSVGMEATVEMTTETEQEILNLLNKQEAEEKKNETEKVDHLGKIVVTCPFCKKEFERKES